MHYNFSVKMDHLKSKFKMGQRKSKEAANSANSTGNTTSSSAGSGESSGNYSPPRGLKDILSSETRTNEFRSYLDGIDEENEDNVMVLRLDFVLACRKMQRLIHGRDSLPRHHAVYTGGAAGKQTYSNRSDDILIDVMGIKV